VLFDSLIVSTVILLDSLNSNIVLSSMSKSSALYAFLGKSTLRFPNSLAKSTILLSNFLALTNVPSSSIS